MDCLDEWKFIVACRDSEPVRELRGDPTASWLGQGFWHPQRSTERSCKGPVSIVSKAGVSSIYWTLNSRANLSAKLLIRSDCDRSSGYWRCVPLQRRDA